MQVGLLLFIHFNWIWNNVNARTNLVSLPSWNRLHKVIRGGELESYEGKYNDLENEYDDNLYDNDEYDDEQDLPTPTPSLPPQPRRRRRLPLRNQNSHHNQNARYGNHHPSTSRRNMQRHRSHRNSKQKPNAAASAVHFAVNAAKKTADVATSTAVTSIKGSTRAAVHLASPKYVSRREIMGVWRFDQQGMLCNKLFFMFDG